MNITVVTQPPFEPVTLEQCYTHLRLDPDGSPLEHPDDAMLRGHIATARQVVERLTGRSLIQRTLRLSVPSWPAVNWSRGPWAAPQATGIKLHRGPVQRVLSVRYYDGTNTLQSLADSEWYVTDDSVPEVRFGSTFTGPTLYCGRPDGVRIEYVAGAAPVNSPAESQADYASGVEQIFKDAILLTVQLLYDQLAPDQRDALTRARDAMLFPEKLLHV